MQLLEVLVVHGGRDALKQQHALGPARGELLVGVVKGEGDAVLVVGEPTCDEPGDEGGQRDRDFLGGGVEARRPPVVGDRGRGLLLLVRRRREGGAAVFGLEMLGVGLRYCAVRED